jgi:anti-anti-sigma factor
MEARDRTPDGALEVKISITSEGVLAGLSGDLDLGTVETFLECVTKIDLDGQQQVVLDLSQLRFCDARGLAALVTTHKSFREAGRHVSIRNPSPLIRRLLTVTKTDSIVDVDTC